MIVVTLIAFIFLISSFVSLWFRKDPKVWGALLAASLLCGLIAGNVHFVGLIFIIALASLWVMYHRSSSIALFLVLIVASLVLKMRLLPGYTPFLFTPKLRFWPS
jgi:hypothetical protein